MLKRGTAKLKKQEEISKKLEEMYGALFDCGVEKMGDNHVLKFYLETVNDEYLPNTEEILNIGIDLLLDIVFNPLTENNSFKEEYVTSEKENLRRIIEAKIDNKDRYAYDRCIEEMYKNQTYGLYKYGYIEDIEEINNHNLFEQYKELINLSRIDIFVSGEIDENLILSYVEKNENIKALNQRIDKHIINTKNTSSIKAQQSIVEKMNITQGKLVIGLDVNLNNNENNKYIISLYNVILGEGATSKLFQNVREKEGLAYTTRSNYVRQKENIYIRCGIESDNYEKAITVIKKQLEDMQNGNFSEDDMKIAKKYVIAGLRTTKEEQDSELSYYFGQELSEKFTSMEEYEKEINKVTKEEIIKVANSISINTIYFLRN